MTNQKLNNMLGKDIDWTHKNIAIEDIRKLNKLYIIKVVAIPDAPLFVKDNIFEERIKSYFLKEVSISREVILGLSWNMYITKGHYIKINERDEVEQFNRDPEKWYVSFLEIAGPLGTIHSIYRDRELNKQ
jgi:hypothetical protein